MLFLKEGHRAASHPVAPPRGPFVAELPPESRPPVLERETLSAKTALSTRNSQQTADFSLRTTTNIQVTATTQTWSIPGGQKGFYQLLLCAVVEERLGCLP